MSAAKAIVSGVSGRYAIALFELAEESNALEAVESDLNDLGGMLAESEDLRQLISSPLYSRQDQSNAIAAVASGAGVSELTSRFLGVLAENRRLGTLPQIITGFGRLLAAHRGEVSAEVKSAHELTDAQQDALAKKLKAAVGKDVAMEVSVDETLMGGLVVKVGSRMVDSSLKTKLDNLQIAMKGIG